MNARPSAAPFMIAWLIAGLFVLPLALALSLTTIVAFQTALSQLTDTSSWDYWEDFIFLFFGFGLLVIGFCIGAMQAAVLRRHLGIKIRRMSLYSALGAALAGVIATNLPVLLDHVYRFEPPACCAYDLRATVEFTLPLATFLGVFSTAQALLLRRYFSAIWLWVAAHLVGATCAGLVVLAGKMASPSPYYDGDSLQLFLAVPLASLFTGLAMLRMAREARHLQKAKPPA